MTIEKQFEIFDLWENKESGLATDRTEVTNPDATDSDTKFVEHDWVEDTNYLPSEDSNHLKRYDCMFCDAEKYEWLHVTTEGKFKVHDYILVGNTQYGVHNHSCPKTY